MAGNCHTCGGGAASQPEREFVYTSPSGETKTVYSDTEAKILVSVNHGGSYKAQPRK